MKTSDSRSARGSYGSWSFGDNLGSNGEETDLDMIETVQGGIEEESSRRSRDISRSARESYESE